MTIAHTTAFIPISMEALNQSIHDQGLIEDLAVRPASTPGQVILYAREGASSWPCETVIADEVVEFDIIDFLGSVAQGHQEIDAYENGQCVCISLGGPADTGTPPRTRPDF